MKLFAALCILALITLPVKADSWIKITEPSHGIYFGGEKIFPLKNSVILIGYSEVNVKAEASSNVIAVYFTMYDVINKDMKESF